MRELSLDSIIRGRQAKVNRLGLPALAPWRSSALRYVETARCAPSPLLPSAPCTVIPAKAGISPRWRPEAPPGSPSPYKGRGGSRRRERVLESGRCEHRIEGGGARLARPAPNSPNAPSFPRKREPTLPSPVPLPPTLLPSFPRRRESRPISGAKRPLVPSFPRKREPTPPRSPP